jgi:hypothetical protein
MSVLAKWVLGISLAGATACATGVVGDSVGEPAPATAPKDDGDAAVSTEPPPPAHDASAPAEDSGGSQGAVDANTPGEDGATSSGDDASSAADTAPPPADSGGASDAGGSGLVCGGYALPNTTASCNANCTVNNCNANGCYGTYWCDTSSNYCVAPVATCDAGT